jgi:hypothetical protein
MVWTTGMQEATSRTCMRNIRIGHILMSSELITGRSCRNASIFYSVGSLKVPTQKAPLIEVWDLSQTYVHPEQQSAWTMFQDPIAVGRALLQCYYHIHATNL